LIDATAASSTAILYDICKAGGYRLDTGLATALYVGLVTDTGRFQYSNTTPAAHRMAADLQEAGLDVASVYRLVYESTPLPKLRLLERALCHLDVRLNGTLVLSCWEMTTLQARAPMMVMPKASSTRCDVSTGCGWPCSRARRFVMDECRPR